MPCNRKKDTKYKMSSCVKCFAVYGALSRGFMKRRKEENPGKRIRQLGLRFISFLKLRKLQRREVERLATVDKGF